MRSIIRNARAKHPAIFGAVVGVALASASAALAFVVYTLTVSGTGTGSFSAPSNVGVITLTQRGSAPALDVGQTILLPVTETNNDPNGTHGIQSLTGTFTTKDSGGVDDSSTCAGHLSVVGNDLAGGVGAGQSQNGNVSIKADASTPSSCASGSYSVAFGGTTS
jgi:hypothetical protein